MDEVDSIQIQIPANDKSELNRLMIRFISKCEKDTIDFASKFAEKLKKNDIIVLSGELGSRKN